MCIMARAWYAGVLSERSWLEAGTSRRPLTQSLATEVIWGKGREM